MTALNFPNSPTNGDTYEGYTYNATKGVWEINVVTPGIGGLVGVDITLPEEGDALVYDGTNWVNDSIATTLEDLSDTVITTPSAGDVLQYDGSDWVSAPSGSGLEFITSEAFTDVASVSLDDCFTSDYVNYRVIVRITTMLGTAAVGYRFRASGSDDTASNYRYATSVHAGGAWTNARTLDVSSGVFTTVTGSLNYDIVQDIFAPQLTERTGTSGTFSTRGTLVTLAQTGFSAATSFDGISIIPTTGNITGKIYVYGYREA